MEKKELRKLKMMLRDSLSDEKLQAFSDIITNNIIKLKEFQNADTILSFVSCRSEVRTDKLIEYSLKCGKKVGVPKVEGDIIRFYRIFGFEDLEPGYFGVLEPRINTDIKKNKDDLIIPENEKSDDGRAAELDPEGSFMIVPGLVFDRKLNRLGYGKGFYDRYFDKNSAKNIFKCGAAFDLQICEEINPSAYDVPLDLLVTESEIIRMKGL